MAEMKKSMILCPNKQNKKINHFKYYKVITLYMYST